MANRQNKITNEKPQRLSLAQRLSRTYEILQPPKSLQGLWFSKLIRVPRRIVLASLVINLLGLGMPIVILQIYDRIIPNLAYETLSYLLIGLVLVAAIDTTLKIIRSHISGWAAAHVDYLCSTEAVRRIMSTNLAMIEKDPASTHIDRMNALSTTAKMFAGPARIGLIDLPFVFLFLGLMLVIAPPLASVVICLFVVFAALLLHRTKKLQSLQEERQELDRRKYDFVIEALSGLENIKTMSCEPQMMRRYERLQESIALAFHKSVRIDGITQSLAGIFASTTMITIVSVGAFLVIDGVQSFGSLACCLLLGGRAVEVLVRSVRTWGELSNFDMVRKSVDELFEGAGASSHAKEHVRLASGAIDLRAVTVPNQTRTPGISQPIDMRIEPGEIVGVRASNTFDDNALVSVLKGDQLPIDGHIYIGGIEGSELQEADLSGSIAYVPHQASIFRGTILENLTLFDTRGGLNAARAASRLIGLEADIQHLPMGYDTVVGSGGHEMLPPSFQQRICIARALARRPKLLLLEEANSLLDQRAEGLLKKGLSALKGSTSMVIVSSRPSFLGLADRCFQFQNGALTQIELSRPDTPKTTELQKAVS